MLKQIIYENVQSHVDTVLNLHEGVNAIIGSSDSGKSTAVRGAFWTVFNDPTPDDLRRHDTKRVSTELVFDDCSVKRTNSSALNGYILNGDTKHPFEAIGRAVPEEIQKALKLSDVNFQLQGEPAYLISLKGGDVARELNAAAGIDEMDKAMSNMQSLLRTAFKAVTTAEQDLKTAELECTRYDALEESEDTADMLTAMEQRLLKIGVKCDQLTSSVQEIQAVDVELKSVNSICDLDARCVAAEKMDAQHEAWCLRQSELVIVRDRLTRVDISIARETLIAKLPVAAVDSKLQELQAQKLRRKTLQRCVENIQNLELASKQAERVAALEGTLARIIESSTQVVAKWNRMTALRNSVLGIDSYGDASEVCAAALERDQLLLTKLIPDVCPLCNRAAGCDHA